MDKQQELSLELKKIIKKSNLTYAEALLLLKDLQIELQAEMTKQKLA